MITFLCFVIAIVFGPLPVLAIIYLAITTQRENHSRHR
jgi:hypothetical protein